MVTLDPYRRTVRVNRRPVHCSKLQFDVLAALMAAQGRVLSQSWLLDNVWETEHEGDTGTVKVMIYKVRQKLGGEGWRIRTVRGVGWRFLDKKES